MVTSSVLSRLPRWHLIKHSCWGSAACRAFSTGGAALDGQHPPWPVIIAGAGPAGLTMALWLSRFGVRSLVLERALVPTQHPQAHYINNRTMEVLRPLWGLSHEVVAASPPLDHWRTFRYAFTMTGHGQTLGVVDHFAGAKSPYNHVVSPEPVSHLPQHRLVPMMLSRATAPNSLVTLLWGHSVTSFTAQPGQVEVVAEDAQHTQRSFQGRFLVAADGAHSTIRQQLGIQQRGQEGIQHLINIHFTSPSLGARLLQGTTRANQPCGKSKAAMLYFVFNREVVGVVVAHSLVRGEFVMQVPYLPPLQSVSDFPEARCKQLVCSASGLAPSQLMDLAIHQIRPWKMNAVVADSFQYSPEGGDGTPRVFLIGDAAHRFPPAGGLGMNTGIQDAHNLAWKLALVARHQPGSSSSSSSSVSKAAASSASSQQQAQAATPTTATASSPPLPPWGQAARLLSTYEFERKPVAAANCALSLRNWEEAVSIPSALGLDPRAADVLNTAISSVPLVPSVAGKAVLEAGLALGRWGTTAAWSPFRPLQLARIKAKCDAGLTLRLQYPKEDLGFQYAPTTATQPTAVAPSPPLPPLPEVKPADDSGIPKDARNAPYVPSTLPGCRLPHIWLRNPVAATHAPSPGPPAPGVSHLEDDPATPRNSEARLSRKGHKPTSLLSTIDVVAGLPHPSSSSASSPDAHTPVQPHLTLFVDDVDGPHNVWLEAHRALLQQYSNGELPVLAVQILPPSAAAAHVSVGAGHSTGKGTPQQPHRQASAAAVLGSSAVAPAKREQQEQHQQEGVREFVDVHGRWHATMQLPPGSVLLVRPDGHVAWRHGPLRHNGTVSTSSTAAVKEAAALVQSALAVVLGGDVARAV